MYPSEIEKIVNSYKTSIPTQIFKDLKEEILSSDLNKESLERLDEKLNTIINPHINTDKYYKEIKGAIQTDIINRVTGFTYSLDSRIREPVNQMIHNTITNVFNDGDVVGGVVGDLNHMKDTALNTIRHEVNGVIGGHVRGFTGKVIDKITDSMYSVDDPTGTTQMIGNFLNNTVNDIGSGLQRGVDSLLSGGTIDTNILNNIGTNLQSTFNGIKGNLVNQANGFMQRGLNSISEKVGFDVASIFSIPTISLDSAGGIDLSGGGIKSGALGGIFDKGGIAGTGTRGIGGAIGSKERIKSNLQNSTQKRRTEASQVSKSNTSGNKSTSSATSVKDRKSSNSTSSSTSKGSKTGSSDEPQEEQYNNDIPPRAQGKNDPRRDNCQEIVLWEGKGDKYVLIRDAKGNYLELNETRNNIRLQHSSGSFIEMRSSGDIVISSSKMVRINCEGARYIKKF